MFSLGTSGTSGRTGGCVEAFSDLASLRAPERASLENAAERAEPDRGTAGVGVGSTGFSPGRAADGSEGADREALLTADETAEKACWKAAPAATAAPAAMTDTSSLISVAVLWQHL